MLWSIPLTDIAWAVSTLLELLLLVQLIRRKALKSYPFFGAYVMAILLQSAAIAGLNQMPAADKYVDWNLRWGTQAVVTIMRSLAVVEMTKKILARYRGIWVLAQRLFFFVGLGVLGYASLFSAGQSEWVILNGVRGLELAMAAVIVTLLLFARFYRVPVFALPRALAVGFCLYSAFYVINYSFWERSVQQYGEFWNFLGMLSFLASLLVWVRAVNRYSASVEEAAPATVTAEAYGQMSSELNLRLHWLNEQLIELLDSGNRRS